MGLAMEFVQDNHSKYSKGVLRGMHFQINNPQGKLVRVARGSVYDAVVDLRKNSSTYGKHFGIILSADNKKMLYIPPGFAHGFLTLEDETEFLYKTTDYYNPSDEGGIVWNDPEVNIDWPLNEHGLAEQDLIIKERDANFPHLKDI